jgi:YHS domain-containing protein
MALGVEKRGTRKACDGAAFAFALWASLAGLVFAPQSRAATTELVISDPLTGIALYGFDPVAYFIDGEAREGLAGFELKYAGVVWRFRNEGNRAAFAERPGAYVPRFGGYDPLGVARGVPASGYPSLFIIHDNRLVLFTSEENRKTFLASPNEILDAAEAAWPKVVQKLVP